VEISLVKYDLQLSEFLGGLKEAIIGNASLYQKKLDIFFNELSFRKNIFNQFRSQADKFLSSEFNVFDIINPDENKLSDILSNIFDIHGDHGQGVLFANLFTPFLNSKGLKVPSNQYIVMREVAANGRIDILFESSDFALILENKPFASDQEDQINRYYDAMRQKHQNNVAVVYLNRTPDIPHNFSDELKKEQLIDLLNNKKLLVLPYVELIEYLTECYQQCESNKFRYFLADFMDYIRKTFPMTEGENNGRNE
jgi:hypothetical protein